MPSKYQKISDLAAQTSVAATSNTRRYLDFLRTAARNYKYTYDEQILIHAQKPEATACADMATWNRLGRWVNRGTRGIALLSESTLPYKLRYVFDISDTNSYYNREISLWQLRPAMIPAVTEALINAYGETPDVSGFPEKIMELSAMLAEDNISDYAAMLRDAKADSLLEDLDDDNLNYRLRFLTQNSIAFMVLSRCGVDPMDYFAPEDFAWVIDFNTPDAAAVLGNATSDISEMLLREVERAVRAAERVEKNPVRTFASREQPIYDAVENDQHERSNEHESDVSPRGRLSDAQSDSARESDDWEVWNAAARVPAAAPAPDLQRDADEREAEPASGRDRPDSGRDAGTADGSDGNVRGRDGNDESRESDGMGRTDEQHPEPSRRDDPEQSDLRLTEPPAPADGLEHIPYDYEARRETEYYYHDAEKQELIRNSDALKDHRTEIATFFDTHPDARERGSFIKAFYDNAFVEKILSNDQRAGYRAYDEVLHLWRGAYLSMERETYMRWPSVAQTIYGMMLMHQWLAPDEQPLPTEDEQISLIQEEAAPSNEFVLPQEAIDYVLCGGSGFSHGKLRIYEQFQKDESSAENVKFLKNEYGTGGHSDAIPGTGLWEDHDSKGIKITERYSSQVDAPSRFVLLKWPAVEKRIRELIAADRYLNDAEKAAYPAYTAEQETRTERSRIATEFNVIVREYKDFVEQLGEQDRTADMYHLTSASSAFSAGRKTFHSRNAAGEFALPLMRETMEAIIAANTHLTERCEAVLESLRSDLATELESTEAELHPAPRVYTPSIGDNVHIGTQLFVIQGLNAEEVMLSDANFPLFTKSYALGDFIRMVEENPINEHLLKESDAAAPVQALSTEGPLETAKRRIQDFYDREYDSEADFSDLSRIDLAYTTTEDEAHELHAHADLVQFRLVFYADGREVADIQFKDAADFAEGFDGMTFDDLITFAEDHMYDEAPELPSEDKEDAAPLAAPPAPKPRGRIAPTQLYPDVPSDQRHDHRIINDNLGVGTPSERYYHNVMAIRLLKKLESEGRLANRLEQDILGDYVGWGGLADCFDERSSHYQELKDLLTDEEYAAARESTLTAFYTPPVVIRSIYDALQNMGFQRGNILEPSCGIGNFIGLKPESFSDSRIYGVELDSISGRIAQQLYQNASIAVQGFEKTELPDSFFDVAIGNVPFGNFKIMDKRYDKYNFLIHDYFFARTLDKVRPGGIIAFITSKGTLDKENPNVRKYLAQRADLIGAIRLPNDTFKAAAGTDVTADIIFLQKRDTMAIEEPSWVHLGVDENGLKMNQYFIDNPDMILGRMQEISGPYGPETACLPFEDQDLGELLSAAVQNIHAQITEYDLNELEEDGDDRAIPADPAVRNFSYTVLDGEVFYRENSVMVPVELSVTAANRIKGMIGIRDSVRQLIEYQTEDYPDTMIHAEQQHLNELYDAFVKKYGILNSRANKSVFRSDNSFCLLASLEVLDDEGNFLRKADMFSKRTIRQRVPVTHVDTASEAYAVSLAERAKVDITFMEELTGKSEQELYADLKGVIFLNPMFGYGNSTEEKYLPADEYLSGNVREKLAWARRSAELYPEDYTINVEALERVQPADLGPGEISVRLGATWLPPSDIEDFMFHLLRTPRYMTWNIHVRYSAITAEWNIEGKSNDRGNVTANSTYGTERINAYKIIEQTLNLRDVRIFDYIEDADGKRKPVLNKKETALAQAKQEAIKQAFQDWIWSNPERRDRLVKLYNERFNATRPREYDGSHLTLPGMNPEIVLRPHQLNAVARGLYGGNTLLGHVVGAGKTFTAVAIAQESKRLGMCHKTLIVVPNHLTEQWGAEYLQLYPAANILVATAKDFEKQNRKKICARIATGDYDAVIIGHSQLEKLPLSLERQTFLLQQQIDEIMEGIAEAKANRAERFTVKQMERAKKAAEAKLAKLNDQSRKDDLITFEELGVDKLIIDEAHSFKNLAAFTKMQNVGGISQTEAQKSSDLYMKCRYMDEITGGKGIVFATGTPISNTMVELYTMQRYLQYSTLEAKGLSHFDAWASTFGETVTAIELAPEGTGYRAKTRFARFYNLPELMAMFKEVADIQTADMLDLPVPKANYHTEALKPSEFQRQMVDELAKRAERVRAGMVNSSEDNMLVITNDGRKLALDQRLINPMLPSSETGKVAVCAQNVYDIWQRTAEQRSTQMVFIDLSTPRADVFNVYDAIRTELLRKGIPEEEIAFIHDAKTEAQKKELFGKVRSGQIRVLLGSTAKMGAGTNAQNKLIALHHTDCPWRPADLQQREGRIIRQGNENPEVEIFTYVTENTFDSYLYQLVESKQRFIGQIMTSKSPMRSAEDVDETALSYAEIKALCSGNPKIKEKMDLDVAVQKLKLLKSSYLNQKYSLEDRVLKEFPAKIKALEQRIEGYTADAAHLEENTHPNEDGFSPMVIEGTTYTEKKAAGSAILAACQNMTSPNAIPLGEYRGFSMELYFETFSKEYRITLQHDLTHTVSLGDSVTGNIQRIDNVLSDFANQRQRCEEQLENTKLQMETAKAEAAKPFPQEEELRAKSARLDELNIELNMDHTESEILDSDLGDDEPQRNIKEQTIER